MMIEKYFRIGFLLLGVCFLFQNLNAQTIPAYKINDLEAFIKNSEKPMIINFWATFCIPCIEEIPYFIKKTKEYEKQDVSLLLVSLDLEDYYPVKIENFAAKQNFTAPLAWLNETDADIFCPRIDKEWSGAIPATLFINNKTGYRKFFEDQLSEEELEAAIKAMLK